MKKTADHPGVYLPPPLVYVMIFFCSIFLQHYLPLSETFFHSRAAWVSGWLCIGAQMLLTLPALITFFRTKNTLITIRPATSLQTSGIYAITRNPMYLGLLILYAGVACFKGNYWTFILIPVLILVMTNYIIKREERYLERAFGEPYLNYKKQVKRWL